MRTRSMIEAWSVGALRASWPANSPAALPQQGIRLRNASRQRPEVSGGELFLLPRGFFALLAQGLTNLMASLPNTMRGFRFKQLTCASTCPLLHSEDNAALTAA